MFRLCVIDLYEVRLSRDSDEDYGQISAGCARPEYLGCQREYCPQRSTAALRRPDPGDGPTTAFLLVRKSCGARPVMSCM